MLQQLLAALLVLFAMQGANPIPVQCLGPDTLQERLSAGLPQAKVLAVPDNKLAAFVAAFNALPPRTDAKADAVLILVMPGAPQAAVVFFRDGCLVGRASLPAPLLEGLLRTISVEA